MYTRAQLCACVLSHGHTQSQTFTFIHKPTHLHAHGYTHIYTYTHFNTHTLIPSQLYSHQGSHTTTKLSSPPPVSEALHPSLATLSPLGHSPHTGVPLSGTLGTQGPSPVCSAHSHGPYPHLPASGSHMVPGSEMTSFCHCPLCKSSLPSFPNRTTMPCAFRSLQCHLLILGSSHHCLQTQLP